MGVLDFIKVKKQQFRAAQAERQSDNFRKTEERLAHLNNERLKAEARAQQSSELRFEQERLSAAKKTNFNNSFLGRLGASAKSRLAERSNSRAKGVKVDFNNHSYGGNVFTQRSGSSPYFSGSGNNPYNFSSSKPGPMRKNRRGGKSIVIKL